jgi:hypothetical protein
MKYVSFETVALRDGEAESMAWTDLHKRVRVNPRDACPEATTEVKLGQE